MHTVGLVHLDLNAKNILVSDDLDVKIINIGWGFTINSIESGYIGDYQY